MHDRLGILDRQILRAERLNNLSGAAQTKLQEFRQHRETILKDIEKLKMQMSKAGSKKETFNSFQQFFIPLKKDLPDDPEIARNISNITDRINAHNQESVNTGSQVNQERNVPKGYTGSARCGECHASQTNFLMTTGHAQAYQTLVQQKQNFNLDCLPCHVTHANDTTKDGSVRKMNLIDLPSRLRGVGCESCHGPGFAHAADPDQVRPQGKVEKKVCLTCHTKEHSPGFDYNVKVSKVSCPAI